MKAGRGLVALFFVGAVLLAAVGLVSAQGQEGHPEIEKSTEAAEHVAMGSFSSPRNYGFQVGEKLYF